jgi:DnaJ-class molecular chaperone
VKAKKPKKNPFASDYAPYGTYTDGERGNPDQWRDSFKERMSPEQINEILGEENEWTILGLKPGASPEQIKAAYRQKAKETHPDYNPGLDGSAFRKVRAAYEKLAL